MHLTMWLRWSCAVMYQTLVLFWWTLKSWSGLEMRTGLHTSFLIYYNRHTPLSILLRTEGHMWSSFEYYLGDCIIVSGFEKRAYFMQRMKFWFLVTHIFKGVIATGLKQGRTILQLLHHTCCNICTSPTSSMGMAVTNVAHHKNQLFYVSLWFLHHFRKERSYTF